MFAVSALRVQPDVTSIQAFSAGLQLVVSASCHGVPGMPWHANACHGAIFETSCPKPVSKPKATRKRFVHKLAPGHQRVDCEASGAPIRITVTSSRTANRVKHSVRNLLHSGLRVGHVLLWFDWMQSMTLPLVHEATSASYYGNARHEVAGSS